MKIQHSKFNLEFTQKIQNFNQNSNLKLNQAFKIRMKLHN